MKYGESAFDIIYLLFAVVIGVGILRRRKDRIGCLMGSAVLILGLEDAFHLIPQVVNYFGRGDYTAWLGFGYAFDLVFPEVCKGEPAGQQGS